MQGLHSISTKRASFQRLIAKGSPNEGTASSESLYRGLRTPLTLARTDPGSHLSGQLIITMFTLTSTKGNSPRWQNVDHVRYFSSLSASEIALIEEWAVASPNMSRRHIINVYESLARCMSNSHRSWKNPHGDVK